jgi:hypothetical protein
VSATLRGQLAFGLSAAAVAYGVTLVVAAFVVPAYSGQSDSATTDGRVVVQSTSATLVQENGLWVVAAVAIPLLFSVAGFALLRRTCATGSTWTRRAAVAALGLLIAYVVVTGFSIGLFAAPLVLVLGAAVVLTPDPAPAVRSSG